MQNQGKTIKDATTEELLKAKIEVMNQLFALNNQIGAIDGELKEREDEQRRLAELADSLKNSKKK